MLRFLMAVTRQRQDRRRTGDGQRPPRVAAAAGRELDTIATMRIDGDKVTGLYFLPTRKVGRGAAKEVQLSAR